jgi:uncharacterized membrane protein (UPF0127 family)
VTVDGWAARAERNEPWARRAVWTVLLVALLAFIVRGGGEPADPYLVDGSRRPLTGFTEAAFSIRTPEGRVLDWCALLAASEAAREQGLMGQRDLRGYEGMLFRFDAPTAAEFYMFHTLLPLSIAFFDGSGAFVSSTEMAPCAAEDPGSCPTYPAARPYVHALEVPEGALGRLGIGPGATMTVTDGPCT